MKKCNLAPPFPVIIGITYFAILSNDLDGSNRRVLLTIDDMGYFYNIVNDIAFFAEGCVELNSGKKYSCLVPLLDGEIRTEFVDYIGGKYISEVFDFENQERTYKAYDFEEIAGDFLGIANRENVSDNAGENTLGGAE